LIPSGHQVGTQDGACGAAGDLFGDSTTPASADAEPGHQPVKPVKAKTPKPETPTSATRAAFIEAFTARYGVAPVLAARQNGQLAQVVRMIGAEEAPEVARFFLRCDRQAYLNRTHDVGQLLQDAASLRTQWKAGFTAPDGYGSRPPRLRSQGMTDEERIAADKAGTETARRLTLARQSAVIDVPSRVVRPGRDFSAVDYSEGLPHEQQ